MTGGGIPRIYTDFNTAERGRYWILRYKDIPLDDASIAAANKVGLTVGQRVILYQDEDDFDVFADLDFGFLSDLKRETWFALPDWGTKAKYGELK